MNRYKVGYFVGSFSSTSINRLLAKALERLAPPELELSEIQIRDLPIYSQDYDADFPPAARALKKAIAEVDAILFVTPEFNRSIPGGLKNAIDWASRPWGQNSFSHKPSGVIGTSPGAIGTALAQSQSARRVVLLQFTPDEYCRGSHPFQARPYHGTWAGYRGADGGLPTQLHERAACLHRASADCAAARHLTKACLNLD